MQQKTHIENIRALHSASVTKRATLDQLIWQAPVIALIAQAFLMTIAFDTTKYFLSLPEREHSDCYRFALLAVVPQALERQVTMQHEHLERHHFGQTVHSRPATAKRPSGWRSRPIWASCLFLVSLAGLLPLFEWLTMFDK